MRLLLFWVFCSNKLCFNNLLEILLASGPTCYSTGTLYPQPQQLLVVAVVSWFGVTQLWLHSYEFRLEVTKVEQKMDLKDSFICILGVKLLGIFLTFFSGSGL